MKQQPTLLGCFAHPDDEILGPGGTLAHYAANGVHVELVCATRGEAGEIADPALATPETLAQVREAEMRCAAATLGVHHVTFLDYRDSGMADAADNQHPDAFINAPVESVLSQLVKIIRRVKPQVIITFEPFGGYGHPDHIAIHRHTHAAFTAAANPSYQPDLGSPWPTARLFYPIVRTAFFTEMKKRMAARDLDVSFFDNLDAQRAKRWPDDNFQVVMDISHTIARKWTAFHCHRTQFGPDNLFRRLPDSEMANLLKTEYFALAVPEPAPGLLLADLFDGLG